MKFASLADCPMTNLAKTLRQSPYDCRPFLGQSLLLDISNPVCCPQNLIFFLRPAKETEMKDLLHDHLRGEEKMMAETLAKIVKDAWPRRVANFRFFRDKEDSTRLFLVNDMGEKSVSRPMAHFATKSRHTLLKRGLDLGNFNWHGSDAMIASFIKFCVG
jgi:hypothetical protein